ncbi:MULTISPECIES: hypothetical protein [Sphingobacterium]|uniref:hypothetical protein n=1 Tax=Sphingobacterium TaxID=28453 RepID=UPI00162896E7|nr:MULTISPECIES: hypothetical protein [Sphingobacterium]MBV2227346.1 hypothetical protein [Sphingobacterium mizutaii]
MGSNKKMSEVIRDLNLQRKLTFAIICGGAMAMTLLITTVGLFVKQEKTLILSVLVAASILVILPAVLKLIKLNSILKSGMELSRS